MHSSLVSPPPETERVPDAECAFCFTVPHAAEARRLPDLADAPGVEWHGITAHWLATPGD